MYIFKLSCKSDFLNFVTIVIAKSQKQVIKILTEYFHKHKIAGNFNFSGSAIGYANFGAQPGVVLFVSQDNNPETPSINNVVPASKEIEGVSLETPINSTLLGLSTRVQNILMNAHGITTVGQLMDHSKNELLKMEYLGPVLVSQIITCLTKHGLLKAGFNTPSAI